MDFRNLIFILFLIFTFGCGDENNEDAKNEKNEVSVFLNDKNIKLSKENFDKLQSIKFSLLKNKGTNNCHKSQFKIFFNSLNIEFDKDNFRIKIIDDFKTNISYEKKDQNNVKCNVERLGNDLLF